MNHIDVARLWNENAEAWTRLSRAGYDTYRDYVNTPAFLAMLPPITDLHGLDIGCGEGHNTRLLAARGAHMTAIDVADIFLQHAQATEQASPAGIRYLLGSAVELPFADDSFDFATGFMSFMDMPETGRVIDEAYRVLKRDGFLQFSITHPCFDTPHRRNLRNEQGVTYAYEVGDYFRSLQGDVSEWIFSSAPMEVKQGLPKFKTPRFTHTLSEWLNLLIDTGFAVEHMQEPHPSDETVRACPNVQDAQVVPYFLHVRARKIARS